MKSVLYALVMVLGMSSSANASIWSSSVYACQGSEQLGRYGFIFTKQDDNGVKVESFIKGISVRGNLVTTKNVLGVFTARDIENLGYYSRYAQAAGAGLGAVVSSIAITAGVIISTGPAAILTLPLVFGGGGSATIMIDRTVENIRRAEVQDCLKQIQASFVGLNKNSLILVSENRDDYEDTLQELADLADDLNRN